MINLTFKNWGLSRLKWNLEILASYICISTSGLDAYFSTMNIFNTRSIYGNIFKLRISRFQALAIPAAYKSCYNHCHGLGSWKISTGLKRKIFQNMRREYLFALKNRINFIDYTKDIIIIYGNSYVSYLSTILVIITMP